MSFPVLYGSKNEEHTLVLQPDAVAGADNDLSFLAADTNYGTAADMAVQTSAAAAVRSSVVIKFDLSSIPSSAMIKRAALTLYSYGGSVATGTVNVHRILTANSSWTETGATWNHQVHASSTNWAGGHNGCGISGTDYSATVMGSLAVSVADAEGTEHSCSLLASEVQLMLATNRGMVIFPITASILTPFCTSDHATAAYRPKLVVVYE